MSCKRKKRAREKCLKTTKTYSLFFTKDPQAAKQKTRIKYIHICKSAQAGNRISHTVLTK